MIREQNRASLTTGTGIQNMLHNNLNEYITGHVSKPDINFMASVSKFRANKPVVIMLDKMLFRVKINTTHQ